MVAAEPQVFDLVVHLVRHRDRVVSKDELIKHVWGGRTVSDAAVDSRIRAARKAVGDSGAEQLAIKTMPRKGVRFVAAVREEHDSVVPNPASTEGNVIAAPWARQQWLHELGLGHYAPLFIANEVDERTLLSLTGEDLKEMGIASIGHRRRLLEAIVRLRPSLPGIDMPETPDFSQSETSLLLCLLTLAPRRFLDQAHRLFVSFKIEAKEMLQTIHHILAICFDSPDLLDERRTLLSAFTGSYPQSRWIPMLKAATLYAENDFIGAATALQPDLADNRDIYKPVALIFRAICRLRTFICMQTDTGTDTTELREQIDADLTIADALLRPQKESYAAQHCLPCCHLIKGILCYYIGDFAQGSSECRAGAEYGRPSARARALNGVGFFALLSNNLTEAEIAFTRAQEIDPQNPLIQNNIGFLLIAKGQPLEAIRAFQKIVQDDGAKSNSVRDFVLAHVGIGFVKSVQRPRDWSLLDNYNTALRAANLPYYDHIQPNTLRLAYIHSIIARRIYQDPRYFALEIFSVLNYALSLNEAIESEGVGANAILCKEIIATARNGLVDLGPSRLELLMKFAGSSGFLDPLTVYLGIS